MLGERDQAMPDFTAVLSFDRAFTLEAKDLPHLSPILKNQAVEIGTGPDRSTLQAARTLFELARRLPRLSISLLIFKTPCEIAERAGRLVLDDEDDFAPARLISRGTS
jgi:hypothetical protein